MTLLATERMKLMSTRSPWFSTVLAVGLVAGFAGLLALTTTDKSTLDLGLLLAGGQFGQMVILVMAALAVTTEYRFGTIRTTFQAVPRRTSALLAKTGVVALLALVIGEVAGFGAWAVGKLFAGSAAPIALAGEAAWRQVAGVGPLFAVAAVVAVAVGILVRQSAGAISVVLIWSLLVETLVALIPRVGRDIQQWMPFQVGSRFLGEGAPGAPLGPWASLGYFAAVAAVLLAVALVVADKRDA
ncbi:hypothetical protein [Actinokineospora bangkokensis]|uniref:ABC transporter permease n=1 Tax=Actinokineospora bangkokensis TaxID=1193682 RepID=A0A1Q9LG71_9PSEU|nr:hypothetical protein [Actinokineospora bangkokensis]OLR91005.1 hypothetical protein BJP25_31145 [Actinokineospora bangkokensis]